MCIVIDIRKQHDYKNFAIIHKPNLRYILPWFVLVCMIFTGFTHSYNNGTVSLDAFNPAEALLLKIPLDYDIFEDEDRGNLVEFDIAIGPHASATAVIELGKPKVEKPGNFLTSSGL